MTRLLLLSLLPTIFCLTYDDDFGRNKMFPLAAAAYSNHPENCLQNVFNGTLSRFVSVPCDPVKNDRCSGFAGVLPVEKAIVISFRGTDGVSQIVEEIQESALKEQVTFINGGKVSQYFSDAFDRVWRGGLRDSLLQLKTKFPGFQLWITGHSLGGSMAALAADYVVQVGYYQGAQVKLVTFGEPRTGNQKFASQHDSQIPFSYRVTHSHDLIPHIPLNVEGYYHHKSEVYYGSNMKPDASFKICRNDEDNECSDGNSFDVSITDHLHYFDRDVSEWGESGCKP